LAIRKVGMVNLKETMVMVRPGAPADFDFSKCGNKVCTYHRVPSYEQIDVSKSKWQQFDNTAVVE